LNQIISVDGRARQRDAEAPQPRHQLDERQP
jgi:hypothetical protein